MTPVTRRESVPSTIHASAEVTCRCIRTRHTTPAAAMPEPTPAKTVLASTGRPADARRSKHQAETKMRTHALAIPASARSAIHRAMPGANPMPRVAMPIARRPERIAVSGAGCIRIAATEPTR
jgi:hypothetical protein